MRHDLAERLIAFQQPVQRLELLERPRRQRPAHMLADEAAEPFAQIAGLTGGIVERARRRARLELVEHNGRHQLRLR